MTKIAKPTLATKMKTTIFKLKRIKTNKKKKKTIIILVFNGGWVIISGPFPNYSIRTCL